MLTAATAGAGGLGLACPTVGYIFLSRERLPQSAVCEMLQRSAFSGRIGCFPLDLARARRTQGSQTGDDSLEFGACAAPAHRLVEHRAQIHAHVGQARDAVGEAVVGAVCNIAHIGAGAGVQYDGFDIFIADIGQRGLEFPYREVEPGAANEIVVVVAGVVREVRPAMTARLCPTVLQKPAG